MRAVFPCIVLPVEVRLGKARLGRTVNPCIPSSQVRVVREEEATEGFRWQKSDKIISRRQAHFLEEIAKRYFLLLNTDCRNAARLLTWPAAEVNETAVHITYHLSPTTNVKYARVEC